MANKIDYEFSGEENPKHLQKCKKDIVENLEESEGGIYVGSEKNGVILIGYGETKFIRKGFTTILEHPTMREILLQELENN